MTGARARVLVAAALAAVAATALGALFATDDAGVAVTLPAPAKRIVSLAPNATEIVYAAGAGARLVGVIGSSDWPPEAKALPKVGDAHAVDLERIVALAPDLVVTWPYTSPAQVANLVGRGIPVVTIDPQTIDEIAADVERVGALAGTDAVAAPRAAAMRARVAELRARYAGAVRVRVFYEIWDTPLYTIGGRHLITQALALCGADNVFAGLATPAPQIDVEAVLAQRPDAIVAGADGAVPPPWLDDWKRWPELPAVARGRLYTVDANLLHRSGPRFVDGVDALCRTLAAARAG